MKNTILATGADIKNRILLAKDNSIYIGSDINDLADAKIFSLFKKEVRQALKLGKPDIIACDLHPGYFSSQFAKEIKAQLKNCKLKLIQHHHAHIASVMQECDLRGPVIGVSFDGTGYGTDGNFWGGEFLLVKRSHFKRLGHLKYRKMPGKDKVVSEPWRMLLSILGKEAIPFLRGVPKKNQRLILTMLSKNINSPLTSSAGRIFDAAAALLGICLYAHYEAEGPIKLEKMCNQNIEASYKFKINRQNGTYIVDTDGLFLGMISDLRKGKDKRVIASKFHNSIAEIITSMVKKLSKRFKARKIVLSGGVFQNNFLKERLISQLNDSKLKVFTNIHTPVNDLNISLGQYYVSCGSSKS